MKRKKVLTVALAFMIILFTVMPIGTAHFKVEASEAFLKVDSGTGTVTAEDVKLRTGPAKTFDIICKLKKDQKVTIIGKIGEWYAVYVNSSGNVGSVYSHYVKVEKAKTTTTAKQASATKPNAKTSTKVATTVQAKVSDISSDEQELLNLVNKARKEKGLKALVFDSGLVKIARLKSNDMKNNNYFSHTSKLYGTPFEMMKKYEIKFSAAGENIAGNQAVEKVVKAWSNESGNNLFNEKFTHTGIGIVSSPTYGKIFVQMFIKK